MSVDSIRHTHADRPHIPSQEEAGYEEASPALKNGKAKAEYPKNPVVHRGQDPELFWLGKYGEDDEDDRLSVDIRSLYRTEHVAPETIIDGLYRVAEAESRQPDLFNMNELFGNALDHDELSKVSEYYRHRDGWTNRLIQGDSLLMMSSLLEREGMAGQVQVVYIDPPYGIKYGSNWQMKLNNRTVTDGNDAHVSGEPEVIKAYRDTWELGIHSYLSYLRDRLVVTRELLNDTGSVFVQINDENLHLVRCLLDEVFGSENFISQIFFQTTSGFNTTTLASLGDYILWYAKDKEQVKVRKLFRKQKPTLGKGNARWVLLPDGSYRGVTADEQRGRKPLPEGARLYKPGDLQSQGPAKEPQPFEHQDKTYHPQKSNHWKANFPDGMRRLAEAGRIHVAKNSIQYRRFHDDFPWAELGNIWTDTRTGSFTDDKLFVVQTSPKVIQRCLLMTSDPGDLVLDPTCGSGTTAFVAEQWGRRWITSDTSRIALNLAKQRLMKAVYPYYRLHDEKAGNIRQGFVYQTAPHIMLKHIANAEEPELEVLYDRPEVDKNRLRVSGPFTVETLQSYEPIAPAELDADQPDDEDAGRFEEQVFEHLKTAGIKNGIREEQAVFNRVDRLTDAYLHAEGFYSSDDGVESKAYIHIGPRFGSVSKQGVNEAVKAARRKGDGDWLVILGFAFESNIENQSVTSSVGQFEVTKVRMHDDLLQEGLLKKDKKAASFVTIGEPDVALMKDGDTLTIEVRGLDIYDPIKDQVKARSKADISYWMLDDDYDGSNFVVRQVFFSGGPKDAFKQWEKGLDDLAKRLAKKSAERTLKIEIDDEAFDRLYGYRSHPFPVRGDRQHVAVRVVSQFGEESTKVLSISKAE
jgi:adenine-specific DNA-methyltransferase